PVVSDSRIRQDISDRHLLDLLVRLNMPQLHVSEECRFLETGDDIAGTFVAAPFIAKATHGVDRVARAKHRHRAGKHHSLGQSLFEGPYAHRCASPTPARLLSRCSSRARTFECPRKGRITATIGRLERRKRRVPN